MKNEFNFEKLNIYQKALDFTHFIYRKTQSWPRSYLYNLTDQLRRASLSIPLNIAEGAGKTKKEYKRFISIARASCFECVPLIEISYREKLISTKVRNEWYNHCVSMAKMLSKLKNSIS